MSLAFGANSAASLRLGSTTVGKVYLGAASVWPNAAPALLGLPERVAGLYHTAWGPGINATRPPASYNLQYMFHATPKSSNTGAFEFKYNLPTNMAAARARGTRLLLTCGGAGEGFVFTTRSQSQAFVDSIVAINTRMGGTLALPAFDGVDFNNFESTAAPNLTEHKWISQALRANFGAGFIITSPPAEWNEVDKTFIRAMLLSGDMSYAAPQYYDGGDPAPPSYIINGITDWVNNVAGGDASKIVVGFGLKTATATPNYSTITEITTAWNSIEASFPNIRGAFLWEQTADLGANWAYADNVNPLVLSQPTPPEPGAFEFRNASQVYTYSTNVVVPKPAGTAQGDALFVALNSRTGFPFNTPPAGWSLVHSFTSATEPGPLWYVWSKVAGASEPSSWTWTTPVQQHFSAVCACISGASATPVAEAVATITDTNRSTVTAPSVTAPGASLLLVFGGGRDATTGAPTWTTPAGMTERVVQGADFTSVAAWTQVISTSGATGTRTVTQNVTGRMAASSLLIAPA